MVKFRLIGIENNNLPTIFKSSGLGISNLGKLRPGKLKSTASIVTRLRIKLHVSSAHTQPQPGMEGKW